MNVKAFTESFCNILIYINHIWNLMNQIKANLSENVQMCLPIFNCAWATSNTDHHAQI